MTKDNIIEMVASACDGVSKATVRQIVNSTFAAITAALVTGENVSITKFGTFEVRDVAGRAGRNPRTGEPVQIPASRKAGFRPSGAVKDLLNQKL